MLAVRETQAEGLTEGSILEVGSLHDKRYKGYVDKFEPTLLHLDGDSARTSTGMKLAIDLVKVVGMRRAYRIAVLVRNATQDSKFDVSRRNFLVKAASAAAVLPLAGVLGTQAVTATESAPSALTATEAQGAYAMVLASAKFQKVLTAAQADGLQHHRDNNLQPDGNSVFTSSSTVVGLREDRDGKRIVVVMLRYTDTQGNSVGDRLIFAAVDINAGDVQLVLDFDASEVEESIDQSSTIDGADVEKITRNVVVPAASVTAGLGNVYGVVHNTINARINVPWNIARDDQSVPVEVIRIVPGADLIEVDEDAELASTTHGLSGHELRITQTDGSNTHSLKGILGPANQVTIADAALDSLAAGRDTTVHIGPQGHEAYNELNLDVVDEWELADSEVDHFALNLQDGAVTLYEEQETVRGDFEGYTLTVTQGARSASGVLDADNSFTDTALTNFVAGADITVTIRSTIAPLPVQLRAGFSAASGSPSPSGIAGTVRVTGRGGDDVVDITMTNGEVSGTPNLVGARARCGLTEWVACVSTPVVLGYETICRYLPSPAAIVLCTVIAIFGSALVCHVYFTFSC